MSLYNLNQILYKAQKEKYGVLATVLFNFDFTEAVLSAAEEMKSPVILMISEPLQKEYNYFNFKKLINPIIDMAEESKVPVVLHLDHGQTYESIKEYINAGLTSVMISGTSDLEENINKAKKISKLAHKYGVTVEGEVGILEGEGGLEGKETIKSKIEDIKKSFTNVKEAKKFVSFTGVDCIAVSIGTSHGYFATNPKINFKLISKLAEEIKIPLVIHGATGLSTADYKEIIKRGIVKLNYYTGLINAAADEARKLINNNRYISFTELNHKSMRTVVKKVKQLMDIFGSNGKAENLKN
jgi:fructose-bisphosphate aldolase class II